MSNLADLLEAEVDQPEEENPNMITISKVQLINVLENPILMKMRPDYVITTRGGIIVGTTDNLVTYCHCGMAVPTLPSLSMSTAEPNHTSILTAHITTIIVSLVSLTIVVSFE